MLKYEFAWEMGASFKHSDRELSLSEPQDMMGEIYAYGLDQ